jgi:hypothetical protein
MAGEDTDDHLEHAFCRMMMALAKHKRPTFGNPKPSSEEIRSSLKKKLMGR